jgi:class 3 adenylate cyclase
MSSSPSTSPELNEVVLEDRLAALESASSWSPRVVSRLEAWIRTGDDYDLFRINPLRYAAEQKLDELESIDLFLHATKVGLFDLDWLIVCGSCSNVFDRFRALEALDPHFVCSLCTNENDAALDDQIQVTFTVSPQVRDIIYLHPESLSVEDLYFRVHFSADVKPLSTGLTVPETLKTWTRLLAYLEPDETVEVEFDLPQSFIGVWDALGPISALFVAVPDDDKAGADLKLEISGSELSEARGLELASMQIGMPEGRSLYVPQEQAEDPESLNDADRSSTGDGVARTFTFSIPAIAQIPTGPVNLSIHNRGTERASTWVVEYPPIPDQAAAVEFMPVLTAKKLLSNQTFRRLFRSETVPASETLRVNDLTYLFTDLKDSTLMYDSVGDVNAYDLVRRHFDALVKAVAVNSGAVTKTIGDAIMATFVAPADAVRAAIDMLDVLADFNATASTDLAVKIGIHRGRSVAVTLNDRIDYFGQDVNIASRIQQLAGAGEIVISGEVYHSPGVEELLESFEIGQEEGIMKGVGERIPVLRIRLGAGREPPDDRTKSEQP